MKAEDKKLFAKTLSGLFEANITANDLGDGKKIATKIIKAHGDNAYNIFEKVRMQYAGLKASLTHAKERAGMAGQADTTGMTGAMQLFQSEEKFIAFYGLLSSVKPNDFPESKATSINEIKMDRGELRVAKKVFDKKFNLPKQSIQQIGSPMGLAEVISDKAYVSQIRGLLTRVYTKDSKQDFSQKMRIILLKASSNIIEKEVGEELQNAMLKRLGLASADLSGSGRDTSKPVVKGHGQGNTRQRRSGHGSRGGDTTWGKDEQRDYRRSPEPLQETQLRSVAVSNVEKIGGKGNGGSLSI